MTPTPNTCPTCRALVPRPDGAHARADRERRQRCPSRFGAPAAPPEREPLDGDLDAWLEVLNLAATPTRAAFRRVVRVAR